MAFAVFKFTRHDRLKVLRILLANYEDDDEESQWSLDLFPYGIMPEN